jgi:hypothetical protein
MIFILSIFLIDILLLLFNTYKDFFDLIIYTTLEMDNNNINTNKKDERTTDKYKVALKLINKILTNIDKDNIDDLTKFVNIDREDIIKNINKESLISMESELFPLFNKKNSGYYRKTNSFVLNCLRGLMKEIGYGLYKSQKGVMETIEGKSYERTHMIYSIK